MNILYTAFNGKNNSSKVLLDYLMVDKKNKLYLRNSFKTCIEQFYQTLNKNTYDFIVSFGEGDKDLDYIKIETIGKNDKETITTNYNYENIIKRLKKLNLDYKISEDAGNYLCNHIYYHGLKYIQQKNIKTQMLFIHVPPIHNIKNIKSLASVFGDL